jgi:formylglycine-generating enzyme required for sulfatase activity
MRTSVSILLPVLVAAAACVTGRTPPEPTKLVPVTTGLTFLFGRGDSQCYELGETPLTCETDQQLVKTWPTVLVEIKPFAIEEHEVTNLQYEHCVLVGGCDEPIAYATGLDFAQYFANPTYNEYPVLNMSYRMAEQYCAFVGRRLPYEWEWERVAAGAATDLPAKRAYALVDGRDFRTLCGKGLDVAMNACDGERQPKRVKASSDDEVVEGGEKIYDLTGNAAEYVAGYYREDVTCKAPLDRTDDCLDCWECDKKPTQPEIDKCKADCYTVCKRCPHPEPPGGDDCWRTCGKFQVCLEYDAESRPADVLRAEKGSQRLAKGGSYLETRDHTCFASVTDRSRLFETDTPQKADQMGIRCAVDL